MIRRRIVARGLVQGVGYRAFVADEAMMRQVEGWVRNRRDGTVEAVFVARVEVVEAMIEACRRGPWAARVDGVDVHEASDDQFALRRAGEDFSVLPTA